MAPHLAPILAPMLASILTQLLGSGAINVPSTSSANEPAQALVGTLPVTTPSTIIESALASATASVPAFAPASTLVSASTPAPAPAPASTLASSLASSRSQSSVSIVEPMDFVNMARHDDGRATNLQAAIERFSLDINASIRRMYGDEARPFAQEQVNSISLVLEGLVDILYVAPPGSGKTSLFLVPALIRPDRLFVVITPLKAITAAHQRECSRLKISASVFGDNSTFFNGNATVVFVDVSHLSRSDLIGFLSSQSRRLGAIFVDEVHSFLLDVGWRKQMANLPNLRTHPIPIVCLSATFPPSFESALCELVRTVPQVQRIPTMRTNIKVIPFLSLFI